MTTPSVNNSEQAKVWINGQYKTATQASNGDWFVEIDGKQVKVDKEKCEKFGIFYQSNPQNKDLTYWPEHFIDYYSERLSKAKEENSILEKSIAYMKNLVAEGQNRLAQILNQTGAKDWKEIDNLRLQGEARNLSCDINNNSKKINRANMDIRSNCNSMLDDILQQNNWQNQLALAKHVQNSFFG